MANIMLTEVCNLRCSYCFANEYVNHNANEITLANFEEALAFLKAGGEYSVGLIGGEPTIHSHFGQILDRLVEDEEIRNVSLFTNGVVLDRYAARLQNEKFHILVNFNSPADIGEAAYSKVCRNLELLIDRYGMKDRITLGLNIYRPDFDFGYLLDILKKLDFHYVRMSLTVPNTSDGRTVDAMAFFRRMKPTLLRFVSAMLDNQIVPHYDCNKMPVCQFSDWERNEAIFRFESIPKEYRKLRVSPDSSILSEESRCFPVVDILPDLTAVRCFGLSQWTKTEIKDFKNIKDLRNYYVNEFDSYAYKLGNQEKCGTCYLRKTMKCTGGCLAYRICRIAHLREQTQQTVQFLDQDGAKE